ncbi:gamma carbonic anhydrase family protein [Pseudoxanthomonas sp.]|uniref:gamma carbonic anhydrase family protein n=1 Tax=Pseudoxanthomonas sp. TaxID=1871049 RepID=UPI0026285562|nr:gamma carbonic anhydrase family protein [Pseudoxanthomonas sp.]WDS34629.1 MAG: gamma carbonic anhydrase family protein [Pseudoxanthomonas sp.]
MPSYEIEGKRPTLKPGSWIAPGAHVIGEVTLEDGASIWFGAVVRGDNAPISIGAGTNVQDGAVLHADPGFPLIIGDGVTVGHAVVLHGCTIGAGSLIGMGAVVMNGATLGPHSLVAANALVTEGKTFPPGSLIMGSPARAVRALDAPAIAALETSWKQYRDKAAAFSGRIIVHHDGG